MRERRIESSAGAIVNDGNRLDVLLDQAVDRFGVNLRKSFDDVDVCAGSVELVLADREARIDSSAGSRPRPYPVESEHVASLEAFGEFDIGLAPLFGLRDLVRELLGELVLARGGHLGRVDLVAATVVVVLNGEEFAATIAALAVAGPLEDVDDFLVVSRLLRSKDVDRSTVLRLALRRRHEGDVPVFGVAHGDVVARSGLETRVLGTFFGGTLVGVAEKIRLVDAGSSGFERREKVHVLEAGVARVVAGDVAAGIAKVSNVEPLDDDGELVDPGVGEGATKEQEQGEEAHDEEIHGEKT